MNAKKNDKTTAPTTKEPSNTASTPAPVKPVVKKPEVKKPEPKVVTLTQLAAGYAKKKLAYDKLRAALEKRLGSIKKGMERFQTLATQIENKLASMVAPNGNSALIHPLAKELLMLFPGFNYEVSGPSGLADAVTIVFFPKDATADDRLSGAKCKAITIITKMPQGGIGIRDFSKDMKAYAPGSVGYASGMNHPTIPVPDNATVQWFAQYVK